MYQKKKEKLYITDLVNDPAFTYPAYYILSASMAKNEMLHAALTALHSYDFNFYETPKSFDVLFKTFDTGAFALYKEKYVVGFFGGKMMYLESHGWKSMPATREIFDLSQWLVC